MWEFSTHVIEWIQNQPSFKFETFLDYWTKFQSMNLDALPMLGRKNFRVWGRSFFLSFFLGFEASNPKFWSFFCSSSPSSPPPIEALGLLRAADWFSDLGCSLFVGDGAWRGGKQHDGQEGVGLVHHDASCGSWGSAVLRPLASSVRLFSSGAEWWE